MNPFKTSLDASLSSIVGSMMVLLFFSLSKSMGYEVASSL